MQKTVVAATANERGKWITTAVMLAFVFGGFAFSYFARNYYFWSLFKPNVPGMH